MKKHTLITLFALLVNVITTSCEKMFFDNPSKMDQIVLNDITFSDITAYNSFNVTLKQDTAFRVIVDASQEFINNIECYVSHDTLILKDNNSTKWFPSYKPANVTICFPVVRKIRLTHPVNMKTEGVIKQDRLTIVNTTHTGMVDLSLDLNHFTLITGFGSDSGIYTLFGTVKNGYFWMRNVTTLNALALEVENARVISNTHGNSYINVSKSLKATLNSHGNIYYQGSPSEIILEEQSSLGRLIAIE